MDDSIADKVAYCCARRTINDTKEHMRHFLKLALCIIMYAAPLYVVGFAAALLYAPAFKTQFNSGTIPYWSGLISFIAAFILSVIDLGILDEEYHFESAINNLSVVTVTRGAFSRYLHDMRVLLPYFWRAGSYAFWAVFLFLPENKYVVAVQSDGYLALVLTVLATLRIIFDAQNAYRYLSRKYRTDWQKIRQRALVKLGHLLINTGRCNVYGYVQKK